MMWGMAGEEEDPYYDEEIPNEYERGTTNKHRHSPPIDHRRRGAHRCTIWCTLWVPSPTIHWGMPLLLLSRLHILHTLVEEFPVIWLCHSRGCSFDRVSSALLPIYFKFTIRGARADDMVVCLCMSVWVYVPTTTVMWPKSESIFCLVAILMSFSFLFFFFGMATQSHNFKINFAQELLL